MHAGPASETTFQILVLMVATARAEPGCKVIRAFLHAPEHYGLAPMLRHCCEPCKNVAVQMVLGQPRIGCPVASGPSRCRQTCIRGSATMGCLRGRAPDGRSRTIAASPGCGSGRRGGGGTAERTGVPHRKHDCACLPPVIHRPLCFGARANLRPLQSADLKIAQYSFTRGLSNCGHGHANGTWHHTPSDVTRNQ